MWATAAEYKAYLKETNPKEYMTLKKNGTLEQTAEKMIDSARENYNQTVETLLAKNPVPKEDEGDTLKEMQHRQYLEMVARELANEGLYRS